MVSKTLPLALVAAAGLGTTGAGAQSITEAHIQYGSLANPTFAGGGHTQTWTATLQHVTAWRFGDLFYFVDFINPEGGSLDVYGEAYLNLSLGNISGGSVGLGPIRDVGLIAGFNWGAGPNVRKFLPGARLAWNVPGFIFLNTDVTAYLDGSGGANSGGAPTESHSFMVDVNWAYPFNLGKVRLSVEGHVEYVGERQNEFDETVSWWLFGQPQFRVDLGSLLYNTSGELFVGTEYQFWINKLGDPVTNESALQALVVWQF